VKTIFSERAATELAAVLTDSNTQLYWLERDPVMGGQALLRRAIEIGGLEVREVRLDDCYPMDLEEIFSSLPNKPGIIVIENYDKSDEFVASLITFTMLYYEYRRMLSLDKDSVPIPPQWKFIITTEPNAWLPSPTLHKRLCRIS
jgi:hypothetical protein